MLADRLYALPSFQHQYKAVITLSVCETISQLAWYQDKKTLLARIDWNNVLSIASVFSYSEGFDHLDAALRISQTCLTQENSLPEQKIASAIILENLTNHPALQIALRRQLLDQDFRHHYPTVFKFRTVRTNVEHSIIVNNKVVSLNKFQKQVYESYENYDTISISAPTSAGKSFILCNILLQELIKGRINIIYLVPTRALISQVECDLRALIAEHRISGVNISTVPQVENSIGQSNVLIFTQERLHWFLSENSQIPINLLIVDEAQKIEDGNRGVLLQQKIEDIVTLYPNVKVYFSSPFTSNPELLLENVKNTGTKSQINTQFVSVNQNLIYARQLPRKSNWWLLELCLTDKSIPLGTLLLKDRPTNDIKKITFIASSFGSSGNVIYANGAAEAENAALILYDLLPELIITKKTAELIKLIANTIHRDYTLCKVLKKGIAFHYGNMPLLIRQEIENLFKTGEIAFLICTSTLLEGVNLPAKSIFIKKPTRGNNKPLNETDFWNLAGRAGRWGKEFSGNIICIEPAAWKIQPNPYKSQQKIIRAIDYIESKGQELLDYIDSGTPREVANQRQDLEFAFGYFYQRYVSNQLATNNPYHQELFRRFEILKKNIHISNDILKRNPGISPIAQQALYDYFEKKILVIETLIPVYPEDDNALAEYINLIGRIGKTIASYPSVLNHSRSILLINWMSGKPLSYLISTTFNWYRRNEKYKKIKTLPVVIREVMDNVENFVRFRFAKDSSCFIDILRYFLEIHQKNELITQIPQLNLWLEFGVSQKTHLSLLSLGLSRNSVIELSNYITNTQMDKTECLAWLKIQNIEILELSPIIKDDIRKLFSIDTEQDNI